MPSPEKMKPENLRSSPPHRRSSARVQGGSSVSKQRSTSPSSSSKGGSDRPPSPSRSRRASSPGRRASSPGRRASSPRRTASNLPNRKTSRRLSARPASPSKTRSTGGGGAERRSSKGSRSISSAGSGTISRSSTSSRTISSKAKSRRASLTQSDHSRTGRRNSQSVAGNEEAAAGNKTTKKANRPTVSPFLRNTHRDLKQQITNIQEHIRFIQDLATMKESKKVDLLFSMIDRDGGGTVDAEELATAMRQNDELSFSDSIEKAIDMVATFDVNGDGELDKKEFRNYVTAMVQELGVSCSDFCEFLVVQLLLAKEAPEEQLAGDMAREQIKEEVKKREALFAVLSDDRMTELFQLFDEEDAGKVLFEVVAKVLYQVTMQTDDNVIHEAIEVLLMIDKDDTRMLDYEGFGRLIMNVVKTTNRPLEDIADAVMELVENQTAWDENFGSELMAEGSSVMENSSLQNENDDIDSLTYKRLKKLFHLWDADGDGDISVQELSDGLRTFQKASGMDNVDADALANALIGFDIDGDNQLDPREFSHAMVHYAKQFGIELHSLIDFMVLSSAIGEEAMETVQQVVAANSASTDSTPPTATPPLTHSVPPVEEDHEFVQGDVDFWE